MPRNARKNQEKTRKTQIAILSVWFLSKLKLCKIYGSKDDNPLFNKGLSAPGDFGAGPGPEKGPGALLRAPGAGPAPLGLEP